MQPAIFNSLSDATLALARDVGGASHRFSLEQYHEMIERGIFQEDERVELLKGVMVGKPPIRKRHRTVVTHAAELLAAKLPPGWHLMVQQPVTLGNSEPEPDLTVVEGRSLDYRDRDIGAANLGLVVEVADVSLARDLAIKLPLYASCGVTLFWLVNLVGNCIEVYSAPVAATGNETARFQSRQVVSQSDFVELTLAGQDWGTWAAAEFLP